MQHNLTDYPQEINDRFAAIQTSLLSIDRHLTQLLDMSLLEDDRIQLKIEPVDISTLLEQIKVSFERTIDNHFVSLIKNATPIFLTTDADRINQILVNLLQNAAKYSPAGSPIELSLTRSKSEVTIAVQDFGLGIKETDFEYIFDPYARLARDTNNTQGLGLGLYISKTLTQALGGTLTVSSTLGSGSTFTLTLPLKS